MDNKKLEPDGQALQGKEKSLQKLAEEYDFTKDLKEKSFIDIKDTAGQWCFAQVIKCSESMVRIHYDGWSNKYDEVMVLL